MQTHGPVVLGRVAGAEWPIEATLLAWEGYHMTLLTAHSAGEQRPVGMEILPIRTPSFNPQLREQWSRRWMASLRRLQYSDSPLLITPLPASLDVTDALAAIRRYLEETAEARLGDKLKRLEERTAGFDDVASGSALDAYVYARAVMDGESPSKALARAHAITLRSAEGRIRRARERGMLSAPPSTRTPSLLTEKAALTLEQLDGKRPYPYLAEDGGVVTGPT